MTTVPERGSGPLAAITAELASEFAGWFGAETIERYVSESYELLAASATVHTYLPVLAGRFARERLRAIAHNQGALVNDVPEVLFVCVHNAGRSQAAAALLDHHAAGRVHVRSAGSAPSGEVNPAVVAVLAERGIDIVKEFPKPLTDEVIHAADVVITMGCGDACPIYPGKRYLDWALDDPAGTPVDQVRPIVDEIERLVQALLTELVGETQH
jgi:arsenate reductase